MQFGFGAAAERERVLEGRKKEGRLVLYAGMDTDEASSPYETSSRRSIRS